MRKLINSCEAVDVEYRVIRALPYLPIRAVWRKLASLLLAPTLMGLIGGGTYLGYPMTGWSMAMFLAAIAALTTPHHKQLALPATMLGLLLGLTSCSSSTQPTAQEQVALKADIREAARYRDPRAGWKPKPLRVQGAPSAHSCPQEKCDERR